MTIERVVTVRGKIKSITDVIPGHEERLSPTSLVRFFKVQLYTGCTEVYVRVVSDDDIEIYRQDFDGYDKKIGKPRTVTLSKNGINEHSIQSDTNLFGRVISFRWYPSITHIDPQDEQAIQGLIIKGTYTPEVAQEVREQLIYEAIQRRRLPPPSKK